MKLIAYTKKGCPDSARAIELLGDLPPANFEERKVDPAQPPAELALLGHAGHYPFIVLITEEPPEQEVIALKLHSSREFQR